MGGNARGSGFGLLWNIALGILGSFAGGWLPGQLGLVIRMGSPTVSLIVTSVIGAVVALIVAGLVRRR